jgi:hypothetical protein
MTAVASGVAPDACECLSTNATRAGVSATDSVAAAIVVGRVLLAREAW